MKGHGEGGGGEREGRAIRSKKPRGCCFFYSAPLIPFWSARSQFTPSPVSSRILWAGTGEKASWSWRWACFTTKPWAHQRPHRFAFCSPFLGSLQTHICHPFSPRNTAGANQIGSAGKNTACTQAGSGGTDATALWWSSWDLAAESERAVQCVRLTCSTCLLSKGLWGWQAPGSAERPWSHPKLC